MKRDPHIEKNKISTFIKETLHNAGFQNVILAVSGGIDSATSLYVLKETIPLSQIYVVHLPYFDHTIPYFEETIRPLSIPKQNILLSPIKEIVDTILKNLKISDSDKLRKGNVMARVRMIFLFDLAKKYNALVCGTENKSESYLGYFTRFGDAASDFEPIRHLYKTQVRQLAEHLGIPEKIRTTPPSAGLWSEQTDENELGFTYEEADKVLYQHFEKNISMEKLILDFPHAKEVLEHVNKMKYKQEVPYSL